MRGAKPLRLFRVEVLPLSVLVPFGGGDSKYRSVAYSTSVHSAEVTDMKSFSPLQSGDNERARHARALRRTECAQLLKPFNDAHPAGNDNQQQRTTVIVHITVKNKSNLDTIALE